MKRVGVALIGAGPRGLAVLERLSALLAEAGGTPACDVHVVDPGRPGQGIHRDTQPDHLLTNTAAGSTTVFVDASVETPGPPRPGPSLYEWLAREGYRWRDGRLVRHPDGDPVTRDSFVPRAILGRYLSWAYEQFVSRMPSPARVRHHACRAVAIERRSDGRFDIGLASGTSLRVDFVFLATGHGGSGPQAAEAELERRVAALRGRNPRLAYRRVLDPIERLDDLETGSRVAICGMGLTAFDALSMFTHGRGGTFTRSDARRLRYHPSGREPRITLFSRHGLPPVSKAIDRRPVAGTYAPAFFTPAFVERARRRHGKLDWVRDLQPCLEKEMAFRLARTGPAGERDAGTFEPSYDQIRAVDAFLDPWKEADIREPDAHRAFIRRHLEADIDASFRGNVDDPFKAIADMVRDLNDVARLAVDYAGLEPASHRRFLGEWCSIANRIAAGPPKERSMELLALIEAGIVVIHEPAPTVALDEDAACFSLRSDRFGYVHQTCFDVLIQARVGLLQPSGTRDLLLRDGLDRGLFSAFDNGGFAPSGIAIDDNLNVIGRDGRVEPNCWAMGYVVEGAQYYTYVLPCPGANSRSLRDAGKAVAAMIERARAAVTHDIPANDAPGDHAGVRALAHLST